MPARRIFESSGIDASTWRIAPLSTQPALGGPIYFIRNIVYHAPEGGALKITANSAGVLVYNNTLLTEAHQMGPASNLHFRNNLILGQGAWPEVFSVETFTPWSTSDFNGFSAGIRYFSVRMGRSGRRSRGLRCKGSATGAVLCHAAGLFRTNRTGFSQPHRRLVDL
jgi:hypothetical protein